MKQQKQLMVSQQLLELAGGANSGTYLKCGVHICLLLQDMLLLFGFPEGQSEGHVNNSRMSPVDHVRTLDGTILAPALSLTCSSSDASVLL